jgi:C-terminal processing protease CtpA/Prc
MKVALSIVFVAAAAASSSFGQLTPEQKTADFRYLAGLYAKQYASYEWKRTLYGFDAMDIKPWLDRVARTKDDLDFFEVCVDYIASLRDSHIPFILPSNFVASLGFTVDIYDGKVLIDSINRTRLPASTYGFQIGDEVVSVDGKTAEDLVAEFSKYVPASNERSVRRRAAARIVSRPQSRMPHAPDVGESASVTVRLESGDLNTFTIPWIKTGVPLHLGQVPSPKMASVRAAAADAGDAVAPWMRPLLELQRTELPDMKDELGTGARQPIFGLPAGFQQRQGRLPADFFFSGTYMSGGRRIGFIRIPSYSPPSTALALAEFEREMVFFQANTDGLVVDETRNPGGLSCFREDMARRLIHYPFRIMGYEFRATWSRVTAFESALSQARLFEADQWIIDLYEVLFQQLLTAYKENRGRTGSVPICTASLERLPATDATGRMIAYSKPMIMLVDEFSASGADAMAAIIQDAIRAPLFGWRTNGAGGTNITPAAGAYSEAAAGIVLGMMTRKETRVVDGYPASAYVENVGVQPDIPYDYMTKENLTRSGRPFVDAFTAAILNEMNGKQQ